jgi:hypothetical protein
LGGQAWGAGDAPGFGRDADVEAVVGGNRVDCFPYARESMGMAVAVDMGDPHACRLELPQLRGAFRADGVRVEAPGQGAGYQGR